MSEEKKDSAENTEVKQETAEKTETDNKKEPIESIEKTVEDLKRKIEEISADNDDDDEPELNIPEFKAKAEKKEKIAEIKDTAIKTVNDSIDEIKKKSEQFANSKEVQNTIAFLKQNAVKAVDAAKAKISEIKNDPNLQKNFDDASKKTTETIKKASDATIQKCKDAGDATMKYVNSKLDEPGNEDLKKKLSDAGEKLSEGTAAAKKSIDEFMAKPEVQERLDKAKDTTIDLAEKGTKALKDWLRPDNKDEDK